jgi:phospholipid-binding lipoprotein MlaA
MRVPRRAGLLLALMGMAGAFAGCATPPPASQPDALAQYRATNDPLEPFNRAMYAVNNRIDRYALRPAAVAYTKVLPEGVRTGIHNALANLATPVKLGNDMLQGKPRHAGDSLMRFVINTTIGGLGFFDVATKLGYPDHDTDFGLTLATWGAGSGPFLFLPVLGPGDPRDSSGRIVDIVSDPLNYFGQGIGVTAANWSRFGLNLVDARAQYLGTLSQIRRTALDPYATFRSLYRQHRDAQVETVREAEQRTIPAWFPRPDAATPATVSSPAPAR